MVIRIDGVIDAASAAKGDVGQVGYYFITIHIVAGAGAGLEAVDDELIQVFAIQNLVAGDDDRCGQITGQPFTL